MIFSSSTFLAFFSALLLLYVGATSHRQRAAILLAGSVLFYASWKPAYLLLLGSSLAANYLFYCSLLRRRSLGVLVAGIALNLAVLSAYKYLIFFIETGLWLGRAGGLSLTGEPPAWLHWALPLGISFFTFQMLSALIDVYRGEWDRKITFSKWCLYVSFFPQLIAGPIMRPHELVGQLDNLRSIRMDDVRWGAAIFVGGLIKKVLLADNLAPIADHLYAVPDQLTLGLAWLATAAFALQIYFDFSGYSEMAIGLARFFGIRLPRNFRYPYLSHNFSEFWQRWHVTLSQWLRDYLYISLGGSRGTRVRTFLNLSVTMLLGGLWHGAGWTFVFWGFLHGLYLIGYHSLKAFYRLVGLDTRPRLAASIKWLGLPTTLILTMFTWVFFRAESFDAAWQISAAMMFMATPQDSLASVRLYEEAIVGLGAVFVLIEPVLVRGLDKAGIQWWWTLPFVIRGASYAALVLVMLVLGGPTQKFIYFDF